MSACTGPCCTLQESQVLGFIVCVLISRCDVSMCNCRRSLTLLIDSRTAQKLLGSSYRWKILVDGQDTLVHPGSRRSNEVTAESTLEYQPSISQDDPVRHELRD